MLQAAFCLHGRYCGAGCSGGADGEDFKASPIDELDRACFFHDKCFSWTGTIVANCKECWCNAQLANAAGQVRDVMLGLHCGRQLPLCPLAYSATAL